MNYRLLLLGSLLLWAVEGRAQTAPPMPRKMAVIDFDRAVLSNSEGIKARAQLEKHLKRWQDETEPLVEKRKTLNDKLTATQSETEKATIRKDISEIDVKLTRIREDAQKDIEEKRAGLFKGIAERVKNVLKQYGEEQGLAVVANNTPSQPGPILIHTDVADVTSEIIRRVNADIEKNPAKVAAAADARN